MSPYEVAAPYTAEPLGLTLSAGKARLRFTSVAAGDFADPGSGAVARLERATGIPSSRWAQGKQVHGADLATVRSVEDLDGRSRAADGQVTDQAGVLCAVRTADCLPILVAGEGAVGALHGGRKGLDAGIVERGVAAVAELYSGPLIAAIGPGARGCCYEVGEDLLLRFARFDGAAGEGRRLDLAVVARQQLIAAGISEVYDCGICTICSAESEFFSYRRDDGETGRMIGATWLS